MKFEVGKKYVIKERDSNPYTYIAENPFDAEYSIFIDRVGVVSNWNEKKLEEWGGITEYQEPKQKKKLIRWVNIYPGEECCFSSEKRSEDEFYHKEAMVARKRIEIEYEEGQFDE